MNANDPSQPGTPSQSGVPPAGGSATGGLPPLVPDYDLVRRIGHGAYGDVWLARSKATGALRAAKIVWRRSFDNDRPFHREFEGIQRFERISREHPSQLALFHIGRNEPEGYFYYVMELADDAVERKNEEGRMQNEASARSAQSVSSLSLQPSAFERYAPHTLRADLEHGRLPATRVLEIGLALTEALSHLHSNGLVHRDVKPSNVIFVNGRPKLADIGLVTDASDQCSIVGTEGYLPPEGPGTPQADIFALGKVLYEAATGLDRRELPKLPEDLRSWPDAAQVFELNEIILKACAQESQRRYQACDEMHAELALLGQGKSVRSKRTLGHRLAVAKKVLVTAAVFAVVAMGALLLWRQSRATRPLSSNPQAEQLYQEAVYELKSQTLERRLQAYTNLTEAIKLDPGFVEAYYGLVQVYFDDSRGDKLPPHFNNAANWRAAVAKLREVNPNSVQFHTANSGVEFQDWKFEEAIEESALAVKLDPSFWMAHGAYAFNVLFGRGDAETALREYRIAERINPSDPVIQFLMADAFSMERKFDLAIKQLKKALQLEPRNNSIHASLAIAYEADKQYDKALDENEQFELLRGDDPAKVKAWYQKLRAELHENGPRGWWQAVLDEHRNNPAADPYWDAKANARLGNTNEVFTLLDRAYKEHNGSMTSLLLDDCWDPFRSDPRFKELVRKMGFRPIGVAAR